MCLSDLLTGRMSSANLILEKFASRSYSQVASASLFLLVFPRCVVGVSWQRACWRVSLLGLPLEVVLFAFQRRRALFLVGYVCM